jgi:hypothetical protein
VSERVSVGNDTLSTVGGYELSNGQKYSLGVVHEQEEDISKAYSGVGGISTPEIRRTSQSQEDSICLL